MVVQYNAKLGGLEMPALAALGDLYVAHNAALQTLALPSVPALQYSLAISQNPSLAALDLAALRAVGINFAINGNGSLCNSIPLAIRSHTTVGGATNIIGNKTGC